MFRTIFAKPNTNEQVIDLRESPVCPVEFIQMQGERPENGDWIAKSDGNWIEKVITFTEQVEAERQWAVSELTQSDRALTPDFPVSSIDREKIMAYRTQLRNPLRSNHKDFPDPAWRPQWPEGVKRPAV